MNDNLNLATAQHLLTHNNLIQLTFCKKKKKKNSCITPHHSDHNGCLPLLATTVSK